MVYCFIAEGLFELNDIIATRDRAQRSFGQYGWFADFSSEVEQVGTVTVDGHLTPMPEVKGAEFSDFSVIGHLPNKKKSFNDLFAILGKGEDSIGHVAHISIDIQFEEKTSKQTKKNSDSIGVGVKRGNKYFTYSAGGSNVGMDVTYRKNYMTQLISSAKLPIEIQIKENDFFLFHMSGGELFTSGGGLRHENPAMFRCELASISLAELKERLEIALDQIATKKRFGYEWHVSTRGLEKAESRKIYNIAVQKEFPATKCEIHFSYILRELDGLELLRSLPGKEKEFRTRVCTFDLLGQEKAELYAITRGSGHLLEISISDPDRLVDIENKLNLKFTAEC